MELRELGEFGLIKHLTRMLSDAGIASTPHGTDFPILIGIGDDAAAWHTKEAVVLATTDAMVEGVHFTRETTPMQDLGWKVMAANMSDIAAMGGTPLHALVTLGLPDTILVADVEAMYHGMIEICREYTTAIAGGDVVRSPNLFISVTLNGIHMGNPLLRSTAQPEDLVAVTGPLGSARGGLELMTKHKSVDEEATEYLLQCHRRPRPRLQEGQILVEEGVTAAIDVSDGLVNDLRKITLASGLAARVDSWKVPVHPLLQQAFPNYARLLALAGGEDYELLYTAPDYNMKRIIARIPDAVVIGQVVAGPSGQVSILDKEGSELQGLEPGWDHFQL